MARAAWLNSQLSSVMLVSIEAAVEFWLALSWSPQAQWLRYSDPSGCLLVGTTTINHAIIAARQHRVTTLHINNIYCYRFSSSLILPNFLHDIAVGVF